MNLPEKHLKTFLKINPTTRKWHLPIVASLCVGIPMLIGWWANDIDSGKLAALAGLSILYIQSDKLTERMLLLMVCCFGILFSYTIGLIFSFSIYAAVPAIGILAFLVHYSLHKLNLSRPPGNFFFLMLASTAICSEVEFSEIPVRVGYAAMGTFLTFILGLIYSLLTLKEEAPSSSTILLKSTYTTISESITFGIFMAIAVFAAFLMNVEHSYWIPISCLAVMQGSTTKNIWLRAAQRIIGTLIGLIVIWSISKFELQPIHMVIGIIVLQIIIEFLIVRNYALAMIFITILTIFLAEANHTLTDSNSAVFMARLWNIVIGSLIGAVGGYILHHQFVHNRIQRSVRKSKIIAYKKAKR